MINCIPPKEHWNRVRSLQAKLVENNLDAYIVHANSSNFENLRYLANHWPLFEVAGAIIPKEGNPLLLIGAEAPGFAGESSFGPENVRVVHEYGHSVGMVWQGVKYATFPEVFDEISGGKGVYRLGMGDYSTTPIPVYKQLKAALAPGGELVRAEELLQDLRMHKSENEIALIRQACKISEKAFEDLLGIITPEMTEYQCEGALIDAMYRHGGEGPAFPVLVYAGERTMNMIGRSTHSKLGRDRLVNIDLGALYGGYASAYGRPLMFGKMPGKMRKQIEFTIETHNLIMHDFVKPGVIAEDVYKLFRERFESHGYGTPPAGAFHGIGVFEFELPSARMGVKQRIEENMVLACDTFFRAESYGFRIEDVFRVSGSGSDIFTSSHLKCIEL